MVIVVEAVGVLGGAFVVVVLRILLLLWLVEKGGDLGRANGLWLVNAS